MYYWLPSGGPANKYLRYAMTRSGLMRSTQSTARRWRLHCRGRGRPASIADAPAHDSADMTTLRIGLIGFGGSGQAHASTGLCGRLPRDQDLRSQGSGGGGAPRTRADALFARTKSASGRPRRGGRVHA
jgi:hypothetical protein